MNDSPITQAIGKVDARCLACGGTMKITMGDLSATCVDYIHSLARALAKVAQERMRDRTLNYHSHTDTSFPAAITALTLEGVEDTDDES